MALYAVHLPLDMHPDVGNNIEIARLLGLESVQPFGEHGGIKVGFKGVLPSTAGVEELVRRLTGKDATAAKILPFGPQAIRTVGIVSGGAPTDVHQAIAEGLDAFVTGEPAHGIYADSLEAKINVICAGHYFTETFGVRRVGEKLAGEAGLQTEFLDVPTGL